MDTLRQDLKFALRMLRKNPGFTTVAVLTLALGIGATTAIFTIVNATLLKSLPFPNPEKLVRVFETPAERPGSLTSPSVPNFLDWKERNTVFEHIAAVRYPQFAITGGPEPERVGGLAVPSDFLDLLGVKPLLGRTFTPEEEQPGRNHVLILGYGFWQSRFGGDRDVLEKTLQLNDKVYTVVGVLPPTPGPYLSGTPLVVPWVAEEDRNYGYRHAHDLHVVARIRPDVSFEQADAEMDSIARQLAQEHPDSNRDWGLTLVSLHEMTVRRSRTTLLVLLGAVGFVLLIACANVANLLLARAAARETEMAVRGVLGAGRGRLLRQLLTESFLLSALGSSFGLALGWAGIRTLVPFFPPLFPRMKEIGLDGSVVLFAVGAALLTGVLFGAAPALRLSALNLTEALKQGRTVTGAAGTRWLRGGLVVVEVALALALLAGAGLMVRSFLLLQSVDPGFDTANLFTFRLSLPQSRYPDTARTTAFFQQLKERLETLPGVRSVAMTSNLPLEGGYMVTMALPGKQKPTRRRDAKEADILSVDEDYFRVLGVSPESGRLLTAQDDERSAPVVVVAGRLARRFWPGENPLGKFLFLATDSEPREVVGVVKDVKYGPLSWELRAKAYLPFRQRSRWGSMAFVLRTTAMPPSLGAAIKDQVWALDPDLPVLRLRSMEQLFGRGLVRPRFYLSLFGIFAGLAAVIAAVGIYGVISYSVSQRTHEIGVRMALGAQRGNILVMVLRQGMTLTVIGIAVGLLASYWLTRFLKSFLFEVTPTRQPSLSCLSF